MLTFFPSSLNLSTTQISFILSSVFIFKKLIGFSDFFEKASGTGCCLSFTE